MDLSTQFLIITFFISLFLSAIFSMIEASFMTLKESKVYTLQQTGKRHAKLLSRLILKKEKIISVILLCNNTVNILSTSVFGMLVINILGQQKGKNIATTTIIMTLIIFIFGEIIPKKIGIRKATSIALFFSILVNNIVKIIYPIIYVIEKLNSFLLKGIKHEEETEDAGDSILGTVEMYHKKGSLPNEERKMLNGVLKLDNIDVKDVMTHRNQIIGIDINEHPEIIHKIVKDSIYTKLPVYRDNHDNMLGVLHTKDYLIALHEQGCNNNIVNIKKIMKKPIFMPGDASLISQLKVFKSQGNMIGFVVDEYGGIMGLITLEDVLEEIIGDVKDEDEQGTDNNIIANEDGSFDINADIVLNDLNEQIYTNIQDEEVTTIGGFIINTLERIPEQGETFLAQNCKFDIIEVEANRIVKIKLTKLESEEEHKENENH